MSQFGAYDWDTRVVFEHAGVLLSGLGTTLWLTGCSILAGTAGGAALAFLKGSRTRFLRTIANGLTDALRAIPVLVVMIWLFYSFPSITTLLGLPPMRLSPGAAAIAALATYLAAQLADIFRAGIDSIPQGQRDVATTLGFSDRAIARHIVVPQVCRLTLPAILGQYASTLLLSSLASVIAVEELLHQAQNVIANRYHALELYTGVAVLYLAVAWPLTAIAKRLNQRLQASPSQDHEFPPTDSVPADPSRLEISLEHVSYSVPGKACILKPTTLRIPPGTALGVFGPSGGGKSSLVRLVAGLNEPSEGGVHWLFNGAPATAPRLGYVPQGLFLWPHLTALENVALALHVINGLSRQAANTLAAKWLDALGLKSHRHARPSTLSGGEAQRVAIARALAVSPEVLLCDEITSSLDPELVGQVMDLLKAIRDSGTTLILVSHHLSSMYSIITHAAFVNAGAVLDIGRKDEVFSGRQPDVRRFLSRHAMWNTVALPALQPAAAGTVG